MERARPRFYSGGIFRRQFLALFFTTVVFFGVASLVIILRTSDAVLARQLELTTAYRDELRSRIADWLSERVDDVQYFARSLDFEGPGSLVPAEALARLTLFSSVETVFRAAIIVAPDGEVIASKSGLPTRQASVADREYFRAAAAGATYVSAFIRGRRSGAAEVAVAAPFASGAKGSGVVAAFLPLEAIVAIAQEVNLGSEGVAYLVDEEGRVISPAFLKRYKELGPEAAGNPASDFAIDQLRAGREGSGLYIGHSGSKVLGAYARIDPIGLGLVVELSRNQALSPIDSLLASGLLFFLAMIVAIFLVAAFLSLRLVAPIRLLIDAAEGVIGEKDFEPIEVRTGTEIDQLAEFFNRMVATIREREEGLRDSAARDSLTGLYNHARIEEFLDLEIRRKKRSGEKVTLVMLDIDHFKKVNDTYGHQAGDEVLRGVSRILEDSVRGGDVAGRYGGEEFSIILDARDDDEVSAFCERIRKSVEDMALTSDGRDVRVTVSLGWTRMSAEGLSHYDFVRGADRALYRAKETGRNKVLGYDPTGEPA